MKLNKIHKIGLEIEGGWWVGFKHDTFHFDVSLRKEDFKESRNVGEIISQPSSDFNYIEDFIFNYWPMEVTDRCAFHIHVSLNDFNDYNSCMERNFYDEFVMAMGNWGEKNKLKNDNFWKRLRGQHKWCAGGFIPDIQVSCRTKDEARQIINGLPIRYTLLNYCYHQYGTIENRLFPTFQNPKIAHSAMLAFIKFVENYLNKNKPKDSIQISEIEDEVTTPTLTTITLKKFNYLNSAYRNREKLRHF